MDILAPESDNLARPHKSLVLHVRYVAAARPYVDPKASPTATLAVLKPIVLHFFGLSETAADGGQKTYVFAADGIVQSNVDVTLESLAHGKATLELQLLERFVQG